MMIVSPAHFDRQISVYTHNFCEVVKSVGTESYAQSCLTFLEKSLCAEHWAVFRFRTGSPLKCLATASVHHQTDALANIDRFVGRCHSVDPSVKAASKQTFATTLAKLDINDIDDIQYRNCFELTRVHERVSLFSRVGNDFYQVSAFRGARSRRFTPAEMNFFAALAQILLTTALKHEVLLDQQRGTFCHLDIRGIERLLKMRWPALSNRESEVCARAVVGKTIESTSMDLNVQRTSVITYRQRAFQKLGISRTIELVALLNDMYADRVLAS